MRSLRSCVSSASVAAAIALSSTSFLACSSAGSSSGDGSGPEASTADDSGQKDSLAPDAGLGGASLEASLPDAGRPDVDALDALASVEAQADAGDDAPIPDGGDLRNGDGRAGDAAPSSDAGVAAEGGATFSCSSATPSLAHAVAPLLIANCSGELCHGGTLAGGFGGAQGAHAALVNVPATRDKCDAGVLVSPGSLAKSYLMNKLTGVGICPATSRMPPGHPLPQTDIQTIADWICSGAPNN